MSNKNVIRDLFINLFENKSFDMTNLNDFICPDYVQYVDGKILNYNHFVEHITTLRAMIENCRVEFKTLVCDGDIVFSNHTVDIELIDGRKAKIQVIAEFRLRNGKLYYCDELTHLIEGASENKDLGSIIS